MGDQDEKTETQSHGVSLVCAPGFGSSSCTTGQELFVSKNLMAYLAYPQLSAGLGPAALP